MSSPAYGTLWVVATPIGNLDDISKRALDVLKQVAVIAAEDTRHTRTLCQHYGIKTPLLALHDHNEDDVSERLCRRLLAGESMALVCDAGTPLVSDPGFPLVHMARDWGVVVRPVPGACAAMAALSVAGLASDRFVFEGFLSAKAGARRERLKQLAKETRTVIFYESSHRIVASLEAMRDVFGDRRQAVLARELTKQFETVIKAPLGELCHKIGEDKNQQRGEFVVLMQGYQMDLDAQLLEGQRVFDLLRKELAPARAAKMAAAITGAPRKQLYQQDKV